MPHGDAAPGTKNCLRKHCCEATAFVFCYCLWCLWYLCLRCPAARELPFPEESLFLDPDRTLYAELAMRGGLEGMFNSATWKVRQASCRTDHCSP